MKQCTTSKSHPIYEVPSLGRAMRLVSFFHLTDVNEDLEHPLGDAHALRP